MILDNTGCPVMPTARAKRTKSIVVVIAPTTAKRMIVASIRSASRKSEVCMGRLSNLELGPFQHMHGLRFGIQRLLDDRARPTLRLHEDPPNIFADNAEEHGVQRHRQQKQDGGGGKAA